MASGRVNALSDAYARSVRLLARGTSLSLAAAAVLGVRVARSQPAPSSADSEAPGEAPPADDVPAAASPSPSPTVTPMAVIDEDLQPKLDVIEGAQPPPTNIVYFQYGVALVAEIPTAPGPICDTPGVPCILGPGGGIAVRVGFRGAGPIYLGLAYAMTKQDPSKLYRFGLLQQARAEGRYYFMNARVTEPYAALGLGVAGYGNEWAVDTWGPGGSLGFGVEYQVTQRTVIGIAAAYRLLYFSRFTDTSGADRAPGIAQLLGLDVVLEQRDPSFMTDKAAPPAAAAR